MKSFFQKQSVQLLTALAELLIGVVLLWRPTGFTRWVIIALGIVCLGAGLISVIRYFAAKPLVAAQTWGLARGLGMMLLGGFAALNVEWFTNAFPVLTVLYGLLMLGAALYKIQQLADALRLKNSQPLYKILSALAAAAASLIVLAHPFAAVSHQWAFTAGSLLVLGALDITVVVQGVRKTY